MIKRTDPIRDFVGLILLGYSVFLGVQNQYIPSATVAGLAAAALTERNISRKKDEKEQSEQEDNFYLLLESHRDISKSNKDLRERLFKIENELYFEKSKFDLEISYRVKEESNKIENFYQKQKLEDRDRIKDLEILNARLEEKLQYLSRSENKSLPPSNEKEVDIKNLLNASPIDKNIDDIIDEEFNEI